MALQIRMYHTKVDQVRATILRMTPSLQFPRSFQIGPHEMHAQGLQLQLLYHHLYRTALLLSRSPMRTVTPLGYFTASLGAYTHCQEGRQTVYKQLRLPRHSMHQRTSGSESAASEEAGHFRRATPLQKM